VPNHLTYQNKKGVIQYFTRYDRDKHVGWLPGLFFLDLSQILTPYI